MGEVQLPFMCSTIMSYQMITGAFCHLWFVFLIFHITEWKNREGQSGGKPRGLLFNLCHVDISWIISGRGNYLHMQPMTRENKGCFYWTTCMYRQKSLHLVVNSMTKNTPRILSCKRKKSWWKQPNLANNYRKLSCLLEWWPRRPQAWPTASHCSILHSSISQLLKTTLKLNIKPPAKHQSELCVASGLESLKPRHYSTVKELWWNFPL